LREKGLDKFDTISVFAMNDFMKLSLIWKRSRRMSER